MKLTINKDSASLAELTDFLLSHAELLSQDLDRVTRKVRTFLSDINRESKSITTKVENRMAQHKEVVKNEDSQTQKMSQMEVEGFVDGAKTRVCEFIDLIQQLRGDLEAVYYRNVPCKYPDNLDINLVSLG